MNIVSPFEQFDKDRGIRGNIATTIHLLASRYGQIEIPDELTYKFYYLMETLYDVMGTPCYCYKISNNPIELLTSSFNNDFDYLHSIIRCLACHGKQISYDIYITKEIIVSRLLEIVKFLEINTVCDCKYIESIINTNLPVELDIDTYINKLDYINSCVNCYAKTNNTIYSGVKLPEVIKFDIDYDNKPSVNKNMPLLFYTDSVISDNGNVRIG